MYSTLRFDRHAAVARLGSMNVAWTPSSSRLALILKSPRFGMFSRLPFEFVPQCIRVVGIVGLLWSRLLIVWFSHSP